MKEVDFNKYCAICVHKNVAQEDEPCNECLTCGALPESHKPIMFKAKEKTNEGTGKQVCNKGRFCKNG